MKNIPWLVLLSLSLVSCSGSKSAQKVSEETPQIELSDADEFIENSADEGAPDAMALDDSAPETNMMDGMVTDEASPSTLEGAAPIISNEAGAIKQYTVEKNETLMLIAFKLYGDYERWKELAGQNRELLKGSTSVKPGMVLSYSAPAQEFVWNPQGLPYLINTGDTLVGISKQVYTTTSKWKMIWDNNRPLIKDPNKIFAGFTIYYLENGREVASEL